MTSKAFEIAGWASSRLMRSGWSANAARKVTMLGCALAVVPIFIVQSVDQLWLAVVLIGLATAGIKRSLQTC